LWVPEVFREERPEVLREGRQQVFQEETMEKASRKKKSENVTTDREREKARPLVIELGVIQAGLGMNEPCKHPPEADAREISAVSA
jgi:hypothetical protein